MHYRHGRKEQPAACRAGGGGGPAPPVTHGHRRAHVGTVRRGPGECISCGMAGRCAETLGTPSRRLVRLKIGHQIQNPLDLPPRPLRLTGPEPSGAGREENCSAGGGGGDTEAHFPNPPPPLLGRRDGRGGSGRGCPTCRSGGGGESTQHLWLKMIPTTQMWGGGNYWWKKLFSGQNFVFLRL